MKKIILCLLFLLLLSNNIFAEQPVTTLTLDYDLDIDYIEFYNYYTDDIEYIPLSTVSSEDIYNLNNISVLSENDLQIINAMKNVTSNNSNIVQEYGVTDEDNMFFVLDYSTPVSPDSVHYSYYDTGEYKEYLDADNILEVKTYSELGDSMHLNNIYTYTAQKGYASDTVVDKIIDFINPSQNYSIKHMKNKSGETCLDCLILREEKNLATDKYDVDLEDLRSYRPPSNTKLKEENKYFYIKNPKNGLIDVMFE